MPTRSLFFRRSAYADASEIVPVVLLKITHADLDEPVFLSTDPTERFSYDPPAYGTTHAGDRYLFILASVTIPDDLKGEVPKSQIVIDNVDSDIVAVLRSFSTYANVDLKVVLSATPEVVEKRYSGMQIVKASYDIDRVTIDVSRTLIEDMPFPSARMTRNRFSGLWK